MDCSIARVHLISAIFIIAAILPWLNVKAEEQAAAKVEPGSVPVLPIVRALNTSQRLWLYKKNYTDDFTLPDDLIGVQMTGFDPKQECTFIKKYNITQKDINFWWVTLVTGDMVRSHYYGTFSPEDSESLGSMTVTDLSDSEPEKKPFMKMTLMHKETNCTVFFVESFGDAEIGCEMYIKNQAISGGPSQTCEDYYKEHCEEKTRVYQATCQKKVQLAKDKLQEIIASKNF